MQETNQDFLDKLSKTVIMEICIDFDGTIVKHEYPSVGEPVPMALETMRDLQSIGHQLILYTMRSGKELEDAVNYCKENGIEFYGINKNPTQSEWTQSPKAYGQLYIDDAAFGCPLTWDFIPNSIIPTGRPFVDWLEIRKQLIEPSSNHKP